MVAYRVYGMDRKGRIMSGDYVACRDDDGAAEVARALLDRYPRTEIWLGTRRVAAASVAELSEGRSPRR